MSLTHVLGGFLLACWSVSTSADAQFPTPPRPLPDAVTLPSPTTLASPQLNEIPPGWGDDFGLSPLQLPPPILSPATMSPGQPATMSPGQNAPSPIPLSDPANGASPAMSEIVNAGVVVEDAPLEDEIVRWYQYPWVWMTRGWENHAEFGLDGSSGNADTLAVQTGLEMRRKTDRYTLSLDVDYRQASASNQTTEDNGRLNLDYDRLLGESQWSMFSKLGLEFDEFKAFDLRLNLNSGLGYYWLRNDRTNLVTRFGAGASKEFGAPDDAWKAEAVFGFEADHQINARQKVKAKVDYFPTWENFADYRVVADLSWETLLDSTDNLSLRLAVSDRYDSTPQGAEPNDFYYSVLLLYKF